MSHSEGREIRDEVCCTCEMQVTTDKQKCVWMLSIPVCVCLTVAKHANTLSLHCVAEEELTRFSASQAVHEGGLSGP